MLRTVMEMLGVCWTLLLLLPTVTETESGDGDMDPRILCTSHILTTGSSLSCKLVGGRPFSEDDEDDEEGDAVQNMTVCYQDHRRVQTRCLEVSGDTLISRDLNPVLDFSVSVQSKRGLRITTTVDLKKIVKPRSPQVKNVTFDLESNQAVILIQTPYHKDYLRLDNQQFQLHIWTPGDSITQNISSDTLKINMEYLQEDTEYRVKVRAIPTQGLSGTWSNWSETFTFLTPAEQKVQKQMDERRETYIELIVCLVLVLVVPSCVVVLRKNMIFAIMWPRIPHPKHTLVQICNTANTNLLLNLKPEEFSALKVEKAEEASAAVGLSSPPCSTQSSGCSTSSAGTEELELSALLSSSSSLQSDVPQPGERPSTPPPEHGGTDAEAEAYVTMSSFYQIK